MSRGMLLLIAVLGLVVFVLSFGQYFLLWNAKNRAENPEMETYQTYEMSGHPDPRMRGILVPYNNQRPKDNPSLAGAAENYLNQRNRMFALMAFGFILFTGAAVVYRLSAKKFNEPTPVPEVIDPLT